ncbi:MAG: amidohydrolase family protein [Ginsengibacter sp.]
MEYKKFTAKNIFDGFNLLEENHVLIFETEGAFKEIVSLNDAGEGVENFEGMLCPGFINCHCHLELSHLKGKIPKGTGLVGFVFKVVTERHYNEAEIFQAIKLAEEEMATSGIVAVGDICNNVLTIPQKKKSKIKFQNFIEVSGWAPEMSRLRFEKSYEYFEEFKKNLEHNSIVPHAPYSVSEPLWEMLTKTFDGEIVSIHNQESKAEKLFFESGAGDFVKMYEMLKINNSHFIPPEQSSIVNYFKRMDNAKKVILVHNTFIEENDIKYVKQHRKYNQEVSYCICINANIYIENSVPPIYLLRSNNCNLVIGTDSLASNDSLNMLDEMKSIGNSFPDISLEELLRWSTINGARALGFDEVLGSFETGKKPGVVLIEGIDEGKLQKHSISRRIF